MNYNINFQVAAVVITALLLYHFLTQKKLHNANVKTFTYILVLSGLYILSDLLGTLTIMNYTAEDKGTVMGILTGIYLLDILIPYILYSCIPDSNENEKKSSVLSVICAGITVAMMIAMLGNLGSGGFFRFDSNGVFQKGTSRLYLDDNDYFFTVAEFQPSNWDRGTYLNIGLTFLWDYNQSDVLYFAFSRQIASRYGKFVEYKNETQFRNEIINLANIDLRLLYMQNTRICITMTKILFC